MSVKTLNDVHSIVAPAFAPRPITYSIEPRVADFADRAPESQIPMEIFLEAENPLGCFRGVIWVVAFDVAVLLLGVAVWQSCKHLL